MSSDSNLNHEAVKFYRDTFRLCPNRGRREDIISTVTNTELWKTVLTEWKEQKWNPLKIGWMLSEYERRLSGGGPTGERERPAESVQAGLSQRRSSDLPRLPENPRVRFRAGRETLAEVVTKALQQNYRSET